MRIWAFFCIAQVFVVNKFSLMNIGSNCESRASSSSVNQICEINTVYSFLLHILKLVL